LLVGDRQSVYSQLVGEFTEQNARRLQGAPENSQRYRAGSQGKEEQKENEIEMNPETVAG